MAKCTICGKSYRGYGNSADPVNAGRCCDDCNLHVVVPARIKMVRERKERSNENGNVQNLPTLRRKP